MSEAKPLRWQQRLARKILEFLFHVFFLFRGTLRFDRRPDLPSPCVIAVYHDEMIAGVECFKHRGFASIASRNHNGYAVAQVIRKAGYQMVYGSTSKGGKEAFYELNEALKEGRTVVFTVDGSRGPRHEMKPGAVMLAKKMKVPLYLVRFHSKGVRLPFTWDRFLIPFPFARVRVNYQELKLEGETRKSIKQLVAEGNDILKQL